MPSLGSDRTVRDRGEMQQAVLPHSAAKFLRVHDLGADHADVTEGTGSHDEAVSWERLAYDWSDPRHVTMNVLDSNVFSNASGHTYSITPQPDGTTDLDVDVVREGKNLKGRVISLVVSTIGKPSLAKALHGTVKAIEARNARKLEIA